MKICNFDFPDDCPKNCKLIDDFTKYGQGSICLRCPVFNCGGEEPLLLPENYRCDWALEWNKFFLGEKNEPELSLCKSV